MPRSLEDFLSAKADLSRRLLGGPSRGGLTGMTRSLWVADAVARARRNVHAVGVGPKLVNGVTTEDLCVRIYVLQKLPLGLLAPGFRLPQVADGIPTDVIEAPPSHLYGPRKVPRRARTPAVEGGAPLPPSASGSVDSTRVGNFAPGPVGSVGGSPRAVNRPLVGGISGANADVLAGTIGWFCRSLDAQDAATPVCILSCDHVLRDQTGSYAERRIYQPSPGHGGSSENKVAGFLRGTELRENADNVADAAIATVDPGIGVTAEILGIGRVSGIGRVTKDRIAVRKFGAVTGLRNGLVADVSHDAEVILDASGVGRSVRLIDQLRIEPAAGAPPFAEEGDSGSVVVLEDAPLAVGLLCAGDVWRHRWALASPIDKVLDRLRVALL